MTTKLTPSHVTEQDAFSQVLRARLGSLVDASDDYLLALERRALEWVKEIRAELAKRMAAADDREQADVESSLVDDVQVSQEIMDIRRSAGNPCVSCPTCCQPRTKPYRRRVNGKIVEGCIDACHTDTLLGVFGASRDWHFRPEAAEMRRKTLIHLKDM